MPGCRISRPLSLLVPVALADLMLPALALTAGARAMLGLGWSAPSTVAVMGAVRP